MLEQRRKAVLRLLRSGLLQVITGMSHPRKQASAVAFQYFRNGRNDFQDRRMPCGTIVALVIGCAHVPTSLSCKHYTTKAFSGGPLD
jgi:hypothetical protein